MLKFYFLSLFLGFGLSGFSQTCTIPPNPLSTAPTNNSVSLVWDEVTSAVHYNVKFRTSNTSQWQYVNASANFFTLSGLSSGTKYYWQVNSVCSADGKITSSYSPLLTFTTTGAAACQAPTNLSAGSITNQSATLSWQAISGATGYQLFYRENTANKYTAVTVGDNQYLLDGIEAGTEYVWYVKAICSSVLISNGSSIGRFTTTGDSPCSAPINLTASGVSDNSVNLSWANSDAESYIVSYRVSSSPGYKKIISNTNSTTLSGLASGTRYVWYVQSVCTSITSTISSINNFTTTGNSPCPVPNNLEATNVTASSSVLSWSAVGGAVNYVVKYRPNESPNFTSLVASSNTLGLVGLESETDYVFVVKAICSEDIASQYSTAGRFSTLSSCPVPNNLVVSNITETSVQFNWNVVTGGSSYTLRYKTLRGSTWTNKTTSSTSSSASGLLPGTDYVWQIKTNCQGKASDFSPEMVFTTTGEPSCGKPQNLVVSNITENNASLSWSSATGAVQYFVKYRISNSTSWNEITVSSNNLAISGLIPGTDYVWAVSSICDKISSEFSTGTFKTLGVPPCQAPVNLVSSNIGTTSATLQWDMTENVLNYQVYYKIGSASSYSTVVSNTNSIILDNLVSGVNYYWYVTTNCTSGMTSAISAIANFTTEGTPACPIPQNLNSFNITDNSADLVWNSVEGAQGYVFSFKAKNSSTYSKSTTSVNTKNISGLASGTEYIWYVNAICNNSIESENSELKTFTTTGTPSCQPPVNLASSNITETTVDLTWDAVDNALSYEVRYKPNASSKYGYFTVESNSAFIPGLQPNTEYVWYVKTHCSTNLTSSISQVLRFTTSAGGMESLSSSPRADAFSITSEANNIIIHFQDNESANGHILVYNATGKMIKRIDNMTSTQSLRSIDISPAYYNSLLIVKVITNDGEFTKKIIFK